MTACSDRDLSLRFSGRSMATSTMLMAASAAETIGRRMRNGRRFPCKHHKRMTSREECRLRFCAGDVGCRPGNTPCALGQLAAMEAA